jgi:mannan endo-1,4-beta-mannosidase
MKKKNVLGFLLFTALLSITACSDDDSRYAGFTGNTGATDEVADLLTTENARSYMVDAGATNETVALFYNCLKQSTL